MSWKALLDEAFQKGEKVKEDLMVEIVHSRLFTELIQNETFVQAVTTVIRTKDEIANQLSKHVKQVLSVLDIPSRRDLDEMNTTVARLSHELERADHRTRVQSAKKAVKAAPRRAKTAKKTSRVVRKKTRR